MAREDHAHLLDALAAIDPATLGYQEWCDVGMALHESGYSWTDWDEWSRRDHARYHDGECEAKWRSFGSGDTRVTSGTIIHMAELRGWRQPASSGAVQVFDWDDVGYVAAGPDATEAASMPVMDADDGSAWDPAGMLYDYIDLLFENEDYVGYVCDAWQRAGEDKWLPSKGSYTRKAKEIKDELLRYKDVSLALGQWEEEAGAWIRFNALDGEGVDNRNVTRYRYALVESDVLDMDKQLPAIKDLHLPCAAVVSSAGKSVHAIVRVDAANLDEYRKRVRWLYDYCDRHGFVTDKQNKNPSRLSRMPGVTRCGRRQMLLATNIGEEDWESWKKWAEESEDDLPDAVCDDWDEPIELKPMLIGMERNDCILRQASKMIVVGDSKMGKSYTLIDLAEAISCGGEWLGMRCAAGPVFYVNLEIDPEEFRWRQHEVWDVRPESGDDGVVRTVSRNFVRWDLRGYATGMDKLAPRLVRRVLQFGPAGTFKAVIIDPIYKVNGGDDNDARAVSRFTNTLDMIIMSCGCAVIYAHHHPKGATGGRKAIDRMSGSGVYGRDADTVLDFSPLFAPEEVWAKFDHRPLYRAEVSCRSFGYRKPIDCVFDWPRFRRDATGELAALKVLGEDTRAEGAERGKAARQEQAKNEAAKKIEAVRQALAKCTEDDMIPRPSVVYKRFYYESKKGPGKNIAYDTFRRWVNSLGPFSIEEDDSGKELILDSKIET